MLAINDAAYHILLFAERNLDPQCLKGFMRLLFKHCVIKVFIDEVPNISRDQWCGHVFKSVGWNFGSNILTTNTFRSNDLCIIVVMKLGVYFETIPAIVALYANPTPQRLLFPTPAIIPAHLLP